MPYPEALVEPMRQELTRLGVDELRTAAEVDQAFTTEDNTTTLVIINSVCGCAAANARPAVSLVKGHGTQPDRYLTVFAGQDLEATAQLRNYLPGIPPSSPFIALMKGKDPIFVLERRGIEGRTASAIATDLAGALDAYCGDGSVVQNGAAPSAASDSDIPDTFKSIL